MLMYFLFGFAARGVLTLDTPKHGEVSTVGDGRGIGVAILP